jgi:glycosyltransferase involved in cell wall biosynthesis
MKVSVIVTTYNWPQALDLVLRGLARQTRLPDEVIVADDGSGAETRRLLEDRARAFPVPLRHHWQEDIGFRAARSRNRAIAAARGDYVLMLDGDMVMHRDFVADHLRHARAGSFVQGSRALTTPALSQRMLAQGTVDLGVFTPQLERRRNALRWPALAALNLRRAGLRPPRAIKTCNQGWFRADLLRVNGFDERMEGWGREDSELAWRAWHAGIAPRHLRFAALAWHLHHRERHVAGESPNDRYLRETRASRKVRAELGIDQHLAEFARQPLADLRAR